MRTIHLSILLVAATIAAVSCARKLPPPTGTGLSPGEPGEDRSPFVELTPSEIHGLVSVLGGPNAEEARDILVRVSPESFPVLKELAVMGDESVVRRVLAVLADHIDPQGRRILRDLCSGNLALWKRIVALQVLESIAVECSTDFLRPLFKILASDRDKSIRLAVLRVLVKRPVPPLSPRLFPLLADSDGELRGAATRALQSLVSRDPSSADELGRALDGVEPEAARLALARILAEVNRIEGVRTLHFLLESSDPAVRLEAVRILGDRTRP
ncbi:MAG: HEAT repeat domain-containing protein, partial [Planctomycetota bacterium]